MDRNESPLTPILSSGESHFADRRLFIRALNPIAHGILFRHISCTDRVIVPVLKNFPQEFPFKFQTTSPVYDLALVVLPIAAAGYSMLYLLFGGGLGGAVVIYVGAKLLGK